MLCLASASARLSAASIDTSVSQLLFYLGDGMASALEGMIKFARNGSIELLGCRFVTPRQGRRQMANSRFDLDRWRC